MKIVGPKYVRVAKLWVVTIQNLGQKGKVMQEQEWFHSEIDANKFIGEQETWEKEKEKVRLN